MIIAGYKFMIVSSGSMTPTLPLGSLVIVTPCEYEDLECGDIVTMNAGGVFLTHRIVGKYDANNISSKGYLTADEFPEEYEKQYWWVTKGDASDTVDGALTDNIVGKVYEGHAFTWIGTCVRYVRANLVPTMAMVVLVVAFVMVIEWMKGKMEINDIECYETDEE
jgi:signal peptidase I